MKDDQINRRKSSRYDTEVKIYFDIPYDIETKVKYQIDETSPSSKKNKKYSAVSKNVSTEGLCFMSGQKLETDTLLSLEVYVPSAKEPVRMKGEVRWSALNKDASSEKGDQYATGVKLMTVEGQSVFDSIFFDEDYKVEWSVVLESVVGKFRVLAQKKEEPSE